MLDAIRVASGGSSTGSNTTDPNRDSDSRTAAVAGGAFQGLQSALPQLQPRIALAQSELLVEQSAWLLELTR